MLRLAKYLKPYTLLILVTVVLLFTQAQADLTLPDYLSRIVNNGIQQGGVESAVPQAVRQVTMERILLFMNAEDKAAVLDAYTLVEPGAANSSELVQQYPALENEALYILNKIDKTESARLNPLMAKAILAVSGIQQAMQDPARAAELSAAFGGMDITQLPPGTDLFQVIARIPPDQLKTMSDQMNAQFEALGEKMVIQAAIPAVKAEYEAIGMDTAKLQTSYIVNVGGLMLLLSLLSVICNVTVGLLSARTAAGMARSMRRDVFSRVESFSAAEFEKFSTASLITRTTNDITQIQMVVMMMMRLVFFAPIMGVGGIIRALDKSASMWWIIALAVLVLLSLIMVVFSIALPKFKLIQKLVDRLNLVARENLTGILVIRAFNTQNFEEKRFDKANQDLTSVSLFINRVMVVMMPLMMFIMNILSVGIIWVGAHQVAQANMQVGDMMAFLQYAMQIVFSFLMLSMMFITLPRAAVSADRVADVLETEPVIHDPKEPKSFPAPFKGVIEFRDVSFRYPDADENVLCGINFTAQPGQTTALIGSTGSGKSTVVNLVPRFYDVTDGAILIDGVDIRDVSQSELRQKIGYIPQKGVLFSGTIESNLRYADPQASESQLRDSADIAQASEFIFANPDGLQAEIAQGGTNVSGGQKQRLSIARAIVKKPPIYIFDDSFSALDFRTDAALRKALKEKTASSTVLIVTQRVSTIKNADQIIVLNEGEIVGKGTHQELMKTCKTYQEIALSQLSMEELA